jgi:hypothetical protein
MGREFGNDGKRVKRDIWMEERERERVRWRRGREKGRG